jgi:hypothetical protein
LIRIILAVPVLAFSTASCGDPRANFTTRVASDFAPAGHTVSVFGLFKDGRMSADTWDELGTDLSAAFASGACQAEYRGELLASNVPLSSAIDDYVRANGIGDELLDAVAPAATGDTIVVFTIAGKVTANTIDGGTSAMPPTAPNTMMRGSTGFRGSHGPMAGQPIRSFGGSSEALEVSASLFSVRQHRSVAVVAMSYVGDSLPDALRQLAQRLRATLPASRCGAWDASVRVDDQRIRDLVH